MINPNLRRSGLTGLVFAVGLGFPSMAQTQTVRMNPVLATPLPPNEQSLAERLNQLANEVSTLKAQLAADETKLAAAAQTANDAKLGLNFALSGINYKLAHHTHEYQRAKFDWVTVQINGAPHLSPKNSLVPDITSEPK